MYNFVCKDNLCKVDFSQDQNPVSQVPPPSLSEIINEARQTGQMPYGSQRKPLPSYTDNFEDQQYFDGRDKIDGQVNAIAFASLITDKEKELEDHKKKLENQKKVLSEAKKPITITPPETVND